MLGMVSHYVADVTWHGLSWTPHGYGLIETLGSQNFGCDGNLCSVAHTAADTGGEYVASWATDLSFEEATQWAVPTEHLHNIFLSIGDNFTVAQLNECHAIFFVEVEAVRYLADLVFWENDKAPWLVEHYIEHRLGGVDDMAVWSGRMFDRLASWFENGPPSPVPPLEAKRSRAERAVVGDTPAARELRRLAGQALSKAMPEYAAAHTDGGVLHLSAAGDAELREAARSAMLRAAAAPGAAGDALRRAISAVGGRDAVLLQADVERAVQDLQERKAPVASPQKGALPDPLLSGDAPLQYVGDSVAVGDFNGDGNDDLASAGWGVSAPKLAQAGAVTVVFGAAGFVSGGAAPPNATAALTTSAVSSRLGYRLLALDFNLDGVDDLVASAPSAGFDWSKTCDVPTTPYLGAIHVWFGKAGSANPFASNPAPDVTINGDVELQGLGLGALVAADVTGDGHNDLVVGSPLARGGDAPDADEDIQRGDVRAYASAASRVAGQVMNASQTHFTLVGANNFDRFGEALAATDGLLVVGAPGARVAGTTDSYGAVQAFAIGATAPAPAWALNGSIANAAFGRSVAVGYPLGKGGPLHVAVGSPAATTASAAEGRVDVFSVPSTAQGDAPAAPALRATLNASSFGGRFGTRVQFAPLVAGNDTDALLASAPLNGTLLPPGHQTGALLVWKGGASFPSGAVPACEGTADAQVLGEAPFGRLGASFALLRGGSGGETAVIAVGVPRGASDAGDEMAGHVALVQLQP